VEEPTTGCPKPYPFEVFLSMYKLAEKNVMRNELKLAVHLDFFLMGAADGSGAFY